MLETLPSPAAVPAPASYHWTPALQAEFLGHLAATGSVQQAAKLVGMSPRAAHDLRHRADGAVLAIGWAAAVLIARARLEDAMLDRALFGMEESWERSIDPDDGTQRVTRRRHQAQTGLAMLARLDRMAEVRAVTLDGRLAQLAASDWAGFLALFTHPDFATAMTDLVEQWFATRVAAPDRLAQIVGAPSIASEVAQISAPQSASKSGPKLAPKSAPAPIDGDNEDSPHTVWRAHDGEWRTDFPPPPGFVGKQWLEYGCEEYSRELSDRELEKIELRQAEIEEAMHALRRDHFGYGADEWDEE